MSLSPDSQYNQIRLLVFEQPFYHKISCKYPKQLSLYMKIEKGFFLETLELVLEIFSKLRSRVYTCMWRMYDKVMKRSCSKS